MNLKHYNQNHCVPSPQALDQAGKACHGPTHQLITTITVKRFYYIGPGVTFPPESASKCKIRGCWNGQKCRAKMHGKKCGAKTWGKNTHINVSQRFLNSEKNFKPVFIIFKTNFLFTLICIGEVVWSTLKTFCQPQLHFLIIN